MCWRSFRRAPLSGSLLHRPQMINLIFGRHPMLPIKHAENPHSKDPEAHSTAFSLLYFVIILVSSGAWSGETRMASSAPAFLAIS